MEQEKIAIVKSYKMPPLKASAFYSYHVECFHQMMVGACESIEEGMQILLASGSLPLIGGEARTVSLDEMAHNSVCVGCEKPIKEILP